MSQRRMSAMTGALLLLLLLLAAIGTNGAPDPEDCPGLKKMPTSDLHKVMGYWVLVWSVVEHQKGWDLLPTISTSHMEFRFDTDNHTVLMKERNQFIDKSCMNFFMNFTITDAGNHTLDLNYATEEKNGVVKVLNVSEQIDFYESCSECLMLVYKEPPGRFLMNYRRESHHQDHQDHQDLKDLQHDYQAHEKLAECLGIPHDPQFTHKAAADFCHKKSSPETVDAATAAPVHPE